MKKQKTKKTAPLLPRIFRPGREMSTPLYIIGWALRSLVLFCGIFGLCLFIGDGINIYGNGRPASAGILALVSLVLTVICSAAAWNARLRVIVPASGAAAGIGILFAFSGNPFVLIWDGARCLINTALRHMASLGYTSFADHIIGSETYGGSKALVLNVGMALLAIIFAVILSVSLLRRVHTLPAVIVTAGVIIPIFVYNLIHGNGGVSVVLLFICGEIALLLYERKFSGIEAKKVEKKRLKAEKKAAKAEEKAKKKAEKETLKKSAKRAYAIALELTESKAHARRARAAVYRLDKKDKADAEAAAKKAAKAEKKAAADAKKAQAKKAKADKKLARAEAARKAAETKKLPAEERKRIAAEKAAQSKAAKAAKRAEAKAARAERNKAEENKRKTLSASGYAGGLAVIVAAIAVWLPFAAVNGNFATIKFINDPVSRIREYVTAYLRGDDIDLNNISNVAELTPRTLTYDPPVYQNIQMLAAETERDAPVYLRSWLGMYFDPETDTWSSATTDDVIDYRKAFGKEFSPDYIKTAASSYFFPTSAQINDVNANLRFGNYGFDVQQVNLRRINGKSLIIFVPPTVNDDFGVLGYDSLLPNEAKHSHYFDGIYSSRFFDREVKYSTVSLINRLNDEDAAEGMSGVASYLDLAIEYADIIDSARGVVEHSGESGYRDYDTPRGKVRISPDDYSDIDRLFLEECARTGIPVIKDVDPVADYLENEDSFLAARKKNDGYFAVEEKYEKWANEKYTETAHSTAVRELANSLLAEAGYTRNEAIKDPTPVYRDERGRVVAQHDVVMTVINYLRNGGFTYTLEPEPYEGDNKSVLESFLTETKNGYCVHFATSAAMLLRQYGYSVRYCDGYLVNEFNVNYSEGAPSKYKGYALDSSAHAWVEVYYPYLGWVAYETVPDFMAPIYDPVEETENEDWTGELPDEPESGEDIEPFDPDNPEEPDEPTEPEEEIKPDPWQDALKQKEEEEANARRQLLILKIVLICAGVIVLIAGIVSLITYLLRKRGNEALKERRDRIKEATDKENPVPSGEIIPRAKELNDSVLRIFDLLGYPPFTGEQYSEYAARLEEDFSGITPYSMDEVCRIMAKAEFSDSITDEELYTLADFTSVLTDSSYAGLSFFEKIKYRYIKRII